MVRRRKIDIFIEKIDEKIQKLDFEELKNVRARIAKTTIVDDVEGFEDEEIDAVVLDGVCIELYDASNGNLIHRSKGYLSEHELLENKEEVVETILKLFDEDKSRMEICFIIQMIPLEGIRHYNSIARMVSNYDKYTQKMTLGIKSGLVFIDTIDKKMSMLKSIFLHQVPPHWMNNDYKYDYHFEEDKCILNVYRNGNLLDTYTSY